jgi:hypothetical protein
VKVNSEIDSTLEPGIRTRDSLMEQEEVGLRGDSCFSVRVEQSREIQVETLRNINQQHGFYLTDFLKLSSAECEETN